MKTLFTAILLVSLFSFASAADNMNYELGDMKISIFSEGRNQGNTSILKVCFPNPHAEGQICGDGETEKIKSVYPEGTFDMGVNVVFVRTPSGNVLIDTGFGKNIESNLKELGLTPADVNSVLLTHMHGDHIGGLLKDGKAFFPNAKVYLSVPEKAHWEKTDLPKQIFSVYGDKVQTFTPTEFGTATKELLKGISPIAAYGHTPGHTIYMLESGGKKLMVWGDITHATAVQLAFPETSVTYDSDPVMAAKTRQALFQYLSANNLPFTGMHFIYAPSLLVPQKDGGYAFKTDFRSGANK
jgi:glyoxylase-like metal-dependent hydrolase (beta-lactamase superfamily II)